MISVAIWIFLLAGGGTSPTPGHNKSSYPSFGYPPTPPKESPGTGTPGSIQGDSGGYHTGETGASTGEDAAGEMKLEMKPSTDHLMQSMALSGSLSGYPVTGRSHKCQEGRKKLFTKNIRNRHELQFWNLLLIPHSLLDPKKLVEIFSLFYVLWLKYSNLCWQAKMYHSFD